MRKTKKLFTCNYIWLAYALFIIHTKLTVCTLITASCMSQHNFAEQHCFETSQVIFKASVSPKLPNSVYRSSRRLFFVADGKLQLPKFTHADLFVAVLFLGNCGHKPANCFWANVDCILLSNPRSTSGTNHFMYSLNRFLAWFNKRSFTSNKMKYAKHC